MDSILEDIEVSAKWLLATEPVFTITHRPSKVVRKNIAVVILNSGFLNNVGPYRLSFDLANKLSLVGFVVVRMDQTGKGESPYRTQLSGGQVVLQDFDDVKNHIEAEYNISKFVLIGLCSGADDGLDVAYDRSNVSGLVFLDGFCPVNWKYYWWHYIYRIRYFKSWIKIKYRRRRANTNKASLPKDSGQVSQISLRRWSDEARMQEKYETVLKKGKKILAVFSGSTGDYYNHHKQLSNGLDMEVSGLREVYLKRAKHIYPNFSDRAEVVNIIKNWMQTHF